VYVARAALNKLNLRKKVYARWQHCSVWGQSPKSDLVYTHFFNFLFLSLHRSLGAGGGGRRRPCSSCPHVPPGSPYYVVVSQVQW
jgi:hypothetical protein